MVQSSFLFRWFPAYPDTAFHFLVIEQLEITVSIVMHQFRLEPTWILLFFYTFVKLLDNDMNNIKNLKYRRDSISVLYYCF